MPRSDRSRRVVASHEGVAPVRGFLRTPLRLLRLATRAALLLVLVYTLLAFVLARVPVNRDWRPPEDGVTIYVESSPVHCDLVLPVTAADFDWSRRLPFDRFQRVDDRFGWVAIGWGDRGFYLDTPSWSDLKLSTAFRAVFFLSTSAMHVTYEWRAPEVDESCRAIVLTQAQYRQLVQRLLESFVLDESGRPRRFDHPGYGDFDRFFEARGTYSLVRTCNEWTSSHLRAIGVRSAVWTPFAADVLRSLER
jgi:uncharacterized protein (TIGR02117 family)